MTTGLTPQVERQRETNRDAMRRWRAIPANREKARLARHARRSDPEQRARELAVNAIGRRKWRKANPISELLKSAKLRAKKTGIPFDLSACDLSVPTHCPYLDIALRYGGLDKPCEASASLDRINPELGYIRGNVEIVSRKANRLKGGGTLEFLEKAVARMRAARAVKSW